MNGLPGLRLLPDPPVPDGRTVLTRLDATDVAAVVGHGTGTLLRLLITERLHPPNTVPTTPPLTAHRKRA